MVVRLGGLVTLVAGGLFLAVDSPMVPGGEGVVFVATVGLVDDLDTVLRMLPAGGGFSDVGLVSLLDDTTVGLPEGGTVAGSGDGTAVAVVTVGERVPIVLPVDRIGWTD